MAAKGFLQTDLATRAGLSQMVVSRFMRRERQTARTAKKIARCLGYSVRRYIVPSTPQRLSEARERRHGSDRRAAGGRA